MSAMGFELRNAKPCGHNAQMDALHERCVARLIRDLERTPCTVAEAVRPPSRGVIADVPGFYAWWAPCGALAGPEGMRHPSNAFLRAPYVGVSPSRPGTRQRLRGCVIGDHVRGNTGGSTFRFALAALLLDARKYEPRLRIDTKGRRKYVLPRDQNRDLRVWQTEYLRVSWATCEEPWRDELEAAVIAHFNSPLNLATNHKHPYYRTLEEARQSFRVAAKRRA
jgi:hypothetical protein